MLALNQKEAELERVQLEQQLSSAQKEAEAELRALEERLSQTAALNEAQMSQLKQQLELERKAFETASSSTARVPASRPMSANRCQVLTHTLRLLGE
jgi:hypothetical protein